MISRLATCLAVLPALSAYVRAGDVSWYVSGDLSYLGEHRQYRQSFDNSWSGGASGIGHGTIGGSGDRGTAQYLSFAEIGGGYLSTASAAVFQQPGEDLRQGTFIATGTSIDRFAVIPSLNSGLLGTRGYLSFSLNSYLIDQTSPWSDLDQGTGSSLGSMSVFSSLGSVSYLVEKHPLGPTQEEFAWKSCWVPFIFGEPVTVSAISESSVTFSSDRDRSDAGQAFSQYLELYMSDITVYDAGYRQVEQFDALGASGRDYRTEDFRILDPVPEPASMAALGLGAAALIRRRRR